MNLMGPADPRPPACPHCGGWLNTRSRHDCLPPGPRVAAVGWASDPCPGCGDPGYYGQVCATCHLAAAHLENIWRHRTDVTGGLCPCCGGSVLLADQWVCTACRDKPYTRYVASVGFIRAASPELLDRAAASAHASQPIVLAAGGRGGSSSFTPVRRYPPPPPEWPGYAAAARRLGQMTAVSVAVIGIPATLTHSWSSAWPPLLTVLLVIQILHLFAWRHRND